VNGAGAPRETLFLTLSKEDDMRFRYAPAAILMCLGPVLADGPGQQQEARKAILGVLDAQVKAWNKGDLDGFMVGYWESPELSFFSDKTKTKVAPGLAHRPRPHILVSRARFPAPLRWDGFPIRPGFAGRMGNPSH
jgi:hypothetical protein